MNNLESNNNNVSENIELLVNSMEVADLDVLEQYAKLPENPDFETLSAFIGKHGRGLVTNIIERAEQARDMIGLPYKDFQEILLQNLSHLHV